MSKHFSFYLDLVSTLLSLLVDDLLQYLQLASHSLHLLICFCHWCFAWPEIFDQPLLLSLQYLILVTLSDLLFSLQWCHVQLSVVTCYWMNSVLWKSVSAGCSQSLILWGIIWNFSKPFRPIFLLNNWIFYFFNFLFFRTPVFFDVLSCIPQIVEAHVTVAVLVFRLNVIVQLMSYCLSSWTSHLSTGHTAEPCHLCK